MPGNVAMFEKLPNIVEKTEELWEFEDIYNKPTLIPWSWAPTIFLWA